MNFRGKDQETGFNVKIVPFSAERAASENGYEMREIFSFRIQSMYRTQDYIKLDEEYKAISSEIRSKAPELKSLLNDVDDNIVGKEIQCFEEGYRAGMADIMTALTFNNSQITHTALVDFGAMDKERSAIRGS